MVASVPRRKFLPKKTKEAVLFLIEREEKECDYRKLFDRYKDVPNVVFLIDPPYLSTEVGTYTMNWGLSDYLDVLQTLVGTNYIYFTSNKSSIIELCDWMGRNNAR